jgi:hypothetical protein
MQREIRRTIARGKQYGHGKARQQAGSAEQQGRARDGMLGHGAALS